MKRSIVLSCLVLVALVCAVPATMAYDGVEGSGNRASEVREISGFSQVELKGSPDVRITVGTGPLVTVHGDDNILPIITTEVHGDKLVISSSKGYSTRIGIDIEIEVPSLEGVALIGSGDIDVDGLNADAFAVVLKGSGDVVASGSVDTVSADLKGSGDIDLSDLQARTARAALYGSGDILVHATESLDARVAGSGDIEYAGDPASMTTDVQGSGEISSRR